MSPRTTEPADSGTAADADAGELHVPVLGAEALPGLQVGDLERTPGERKRLYVSLRLKLIAVVAIALAWAGLSLWIAIPWIEDLGASITMPLAVAVIFGIAIIPGYLNANLIASLLIDRPPPLRFDLTFPAITVLISCFEEEESISETLDYVAAQDYPGDVHVLVADDGSRDRTVAIARERAADDPRIAVRPLSHAGKARTLTRALAEVRTPLIATVDADTLLTPSALRRAVARLLISPRTPSPSPAPSSSATRAATSSPGRRSGTTSSASPRSSASKDCSRERWSPRGRSASTAPTRWPPPVAGRTGSARTSC